MPTTSERIGSSRVTCTALEKSARKCISYYREMRQGKTHQASVPHVYSRADCQIAHPDERCYEIADIPTLVGSDKQLAK